MVPRREREAVVGRLAVFVFFHILSRDTSSDTVYDSGDEGLLPGQRQMASIVAREPSRSGFCYVCLLFRYGVTDTDHLFDSDSVKMWQQC